MDSMDGVPEVASHARVGTALRDGDGRLGTGLERENPVSTLCTEQAPLDFHTQR